MRPLFPFRTTRFHPAAALLAALPALLMPAGHAQTPTHIKGAQSQQLPARPLSINATVFPDAYVGLPFRIGIQATGGAGNALMSISGNVPDGLTTQTGAETFAIGGIPTTSGTFNFTIAALDANGVSVSHNFSINVLAVRPFVNPPAVVITLNDVFHANDGTLAFEPLMITDPESFHAADTASVVVAVGISPSTVPVGTYNTLYPSTTFSAVGNTVTVTYTQSGAAPTGMAFTTVSGHPYLYGVPSVVGSFPFTITAKDSLHTSVQPYTLIVQKASQTISFGTLPTPTYGNPPFSLSPTATSGLTVSIAPPVGFVSGSNPYTILAAGLATFTGTQAGNTNYTAAPSVQANVVISPATLSVTATSYSRVFDQPNPALHYTFGAFAYSDNASVVSGTPFINTIASPLSTAANSPFTISVSTGSLSAANYIFSLQSGTLTITPAPQTISFYPLPALAQGSAAFALSARASSGLAVTYTVTGPASISNNALTVTGSGLVSVIANQSGNANYSSASAITRSFTAP